MSYRSFHLEFTSGPVTIPAYGITVLVGPNNSGKSLVLKEIDAIVRSSQELRSMIVQDYSLSDVSNVVDTALAQGSLAASKREAESYTVRFPVAGEWEAKTIDLSSLRSWALSPQEAHSKRYLSAYLLSSQVISLNGVTRLSLLNAVPAGDLQEPAVSALGSLYRNSEKRSRLRAVVHNAIGLQLVIDPTRLGYLRVRFSEEAPGGMEESLGESARQYFSQAAQSEDVSDGIRAFCGILASAFAEKFNLLLIDEPEAFLHPPLAKRLGVELAGEMKRGEAGLIVATHSADFLWGCVQSGAPIRVIRLRYSRGVSSSTILDDGELRKFLRDPLVRSANALSGLFYDGVVVTESDSDRAFYSEIYSRMQQADGSLPEVLFLNAQNKQTESRIVEPLRRFGVPAAAIFDLDFIKDGGADFGNHMAAAQLPELRRQSLGQLRGRIKGAFDAGNIDPKASGVDGLSGDTRLALEDFLKQLEDYGMFLVPVGELENWLRCLEVVSRKNRWIVDMLDRLGTDPAHPTYVRPSEGDVWAFLQRIADWIVDERRRGLS